MKSKRLLRFYFKADDLNSALDNLILACALRSAESAAGGEEHAARILAIIAAKDSLAELWGKLNGVISGLSGSEREILEYYSLLRCGIRRLSEERQREIRRAVIKFKRHARGVGRCAEGIRLVGEYYCLL